MGFSILTHAHSPSSLLSFPHTCTICLIYPHACLCFSLTFVSTSPTCACIIPTHTHCFSSHMCASSPTPYPLMRTTLSCAYSLCMHTLFLPHATCLFSYLSHSYAPSWFYIMMASPLIPSQIYSTIVDSHILSLFSFIYSIFFLKGSSLYQF